MLKNLNFKRWSQGLVTKNFHEHSKCNQATVSSMVKLAKDYNDRVQEEEVKTEREILVSNVGKIDPKRHLKENLEDLLSENIDQILGVSMDTKAMALLGKKASSEENTMNLG